MTQSRLKKEKEFNEIEQNCCFRKWIKWISNQEEEEETHLLMCHLIWRWSLCFSHQLRISSKYDRVFEVDEMYSANYSSSTVIEFSVKVEGRRNQGKDDRRADESEVGGEKRCREWRKRRWRRGKIKRRGPWYYTVNNEAATEDALFKSRSCCERVSCCAGRDLRRYKKKKRQEKGSSSHLIIVTVSPSPFASVLLMLLLLLFFLL